MMNDMRKHAAALHSKGLLDDATAILLCIGEPVDPRHPSATIMDFPPEDRPHIARKMLGVKEEKPQMNGPTDEEAKALDEHLDTKETTRNFDHIPDPRLRQVAENLWPRIENSSKLVRIIARLGRELQVSDVELAIALARLWGGGRCANPKVFSQQTLDLFADFGEFELEMEMAKRSGKKEEQKNV